MYMKLHWQTDFFNNSLIDNPRLEFPWGLSVTGNYIIWADTHPQTIIKVGSGEIKNRLREHINDPKIQLYKRYNLYVTWATIPWGYWLNVSTDEYTDTLRGIEKFIGIIYPPKITERLPVNVDLVFVNIPDLETPLQKLLKFTGRTRLEQQNPFRSPLEQALGKLKRVNKSNPFR